MASQTNELKLSKYVHLLEWPVGLTANTTAGLAFSTRTSRLLTLSSFEWKALRDKRHADLTPAVLSLLREAEILIPADEDEYTFLQRRVTEATSNPRTLFRVILPTHLCNLGCVYCGQEHRHENLNPTLVNPLVQEIAQATKKGHFERLYVTWFGGEPSTVPAIIFEVTERLLELCDSQELDYNSRMVTNGVALTPGRFKFFVDKCRVFSFELSLDGPREIHDRRRPLLGAGSSYERIIQNLSAIREQPPERAFSLALRVNMDLENVDWVHRLIDDLALHRLQEIASIYFSIVVEWHSDRNDSLIDRQAFAKEEASLLAHSLARGFQVPLLPKPRNTACLAGERWSSVITASGEVHNCTLTPLAAGVSTPTTEPIGTLDTLDWEEKEVRQKRIKSQLSGNAICRECKFLFLCQGGCPKELDEGKLPCPSFRFNIGDRLALHFLEEVRRRASDRSGGKRNLYDGSLIRNLSASQETELTRILGGGTELRVVNSALTTLQGEVKSIMGEVSLVFPLFDTEFQFTVVDSLGSFLGKTVFSAGQPPILLISIDSFADRELLRNTLAHEMAHLIHWQINRRFVEEALASRVVWKGLLVEGFAIWASHLCLPLKRVEAFIPGGERLLHSGVCWRPQLDELVRKLRGSGEPYDSIFRSAWRGEGRSLPIGHAIGYLVCEDLASRYWLEGFLARQETELAEAVEARVEILRGAPSWQEAKGLSVVSVNFEGVRRNSALPILN